MKKGVTMKLLLIPTIFLFALTGCTDMGTAWQSYNNEQEASLLNSYGVNAGGTQKIVYQTPPDVQWKKGASNLSRDGGFTRIYIPHNEDIANWSQSLYEIYFPKSGTLGTVKQLLVASQQAAASMCKKIDWKVLQEKPGYAVYQSNGYDCAGEGNKFVVGKIIQGSDGLYELQYFAMTRLAPNYIKQGIASVSAARLEAK